MHLSHELHRISTNVRFLTGSLLLPEYAAALAERLFLTPPKMKLPQSTFFDFLDAHAGFVEHRGRRTPRRSPARHLALAGRPRACHRAVARPRARRRGAGQPALGPGRLLAPLRALVLDARGAAARHAGGDRGALRPALVRDRGAAPRAAPEDAGAGDPRPRRRHRALGAGRGARARL